MADPKNPQVGDKHIDASDVKLVDLHPRQVPALSKVRDGFEVALDEIGRLSPRIATRIRLEPDEVLQIEESRKNRAAALKMIEPLRKLLELCEETVLWEGHQIGMFLTRLTH